MTDPRWTDPRYNDPVLRQSESVGGAWGWIAGLSVLALIAFMIVAGWNSNSSNTANNTTPPVTTGSAPRSIMPPSTTGSGGMMSPQPAAPTPAPVDR